MDDVWMGAGDSGIPCCYECLRGLIHSLHILYKNAGKELQMDDFKAVKANAWSLPPGETRGKLVHVEETKWGKFYYYHEESTGEYWYQSEITEKFHRELKRKEKERRECSRRLKNESKRDSA